MSVGIGHTGRWAKVNPDTSRQSAMRTIVITMGLDRIT